MPAESLRLLLTAALFLILYEEIRTPKDIRMVLGVFITGATFAAFYGIVATPDASRFAYAAGSEGLDRIAGTVGDPNVLAATLAAGLMTSVAMGLSEGRSSAVRVLCFIAAFPLPRGRLSDRLAGGLVALAGAVITAIALAPRRAPSRRSWEWWLRLPGPTTTPTLPRRPRETACRSRMAGQAEPTSGRSAGA